MHGQVPDAAARHSVEVEDGGNIVRARLLDPDQMSGVRQGWNLECRQLSPGSMLGDLNRLKTPQGKMGFETFSVPCRIRGELITKQLQLMLIQTEELPFRLWGQEFEREALVLLGPGAELEVTTRSAIRADGIVVAASCYRDLVAIEPAAANHIEALDRSPTSVLDPSPDLMAAFRRTTSEAVGVKATKALRERLGGHALTIAGQALLEGSGSAIREECLTGSSRRRIVVAAEDYMRRNLRKPISSLEMCRCVGTSERTLELAFKEEIGIPPRKYLTLLRLNKARSLIREYAKKKVPDPVTLAVCDVGFNHPSRFSQRYRAFFGEFPRETAHSARVK